MWKMDSRGKTGSMEINYEIFLRDERSQLRDVSNLHRGRNS